MIRRFGEPPQKGRHYHRRPGAYALLPREGKLLLTCQFDPDPDIQLPGGGIDPGESPLPALHREVLEETGWTVSSPRHFGSFRRFIFMPEYDLWAEKLCHIFLARPLRRLGPPREENHIALWMDPSEAVHKLCNPGDQHFTAELARCMT